MCSRLDHGDHGGNESPTSDRSIQTDYGTVSSDLALALQPTLACTFILAGCERTAHVRECWSADRPGLWSH